MPRVLLVGGKGGVGKTTCAAAMAVAAASRGDRTLVVSTDPAPSLGDALGTRLSGVPRQVRVRGGLLHASEIDSRMAIGRWLRRRQRVLETIAARGTWLDSDDIASLLRLSLPGIDEIAGLLEIARLSRSTRYDVVVVDTAPTGHTLRMLAMPATLAGVARAFDHMQEKHRVLTETLRGSWHGDEADILIEQLGRDARELGGMFTDAARVEVSLVTMAEAMAIEETLDAARALGAAGIAVARVVVNRVTPPPPRRCDWCLTRRSAEYRVIATLKSAIRRMQGPAGVPPWLSIVTARQDEPVGVRALGGIASQLRRSTPDAVSVRASKRAMTTRITSVDSPRAVDVFNGRSARLVLFCGKGGVGKTTCAAAAALDAAARYPNRRLVLVSVDPAHSLADVLGVALTNEARRVDGAPANLHARELDAALGLDAIRGRYAAAIDDLFDRLGGGVIDAAHDRRVMHDLIDLAPPGLDELIAILEITESVSRQDIDDGGDLVVLDTAPTGHALRLLEMPEVVHEWTKALMRILLKYHAIVGAGELGSMLVQMSQALGRLRTQLADSSATHVVVVTRAAKLPRLETRRLLTSLGALGVHVQTVVVNAVGQGACARCRRAAARERREIAAVARSTRADRPSVNIVLAPARIPPPHGRGGLVRWRRDWRVAISSSPESHG
jgi:arsenite-transporting ATPase